MLQRTQPDLVTPRFNYEGGRVRAHPGPWATDQGIPDDNDPDPDESLIKIPTEEPIRERVRPWNWKRSDDEEPTNPRRCTWRFFISVSTDSLDGQTIYLKEGSNPTCYYNNATQGNLSYSGANPPSCGSGVATSGISGLFTIVAPISFRAWWNEFVVCPGDPQPDTSTMTINNNGTCPLNIAIDGVHTVVSPGSPLNFSPLAYDPSHGDESGYGGGTTIVITPV